MSLSSRVCADIKCHFSPFIIGPVSPRVMLGAQPSAVPSVCLDVATSCPLGKHLLHFLSLSVGTLGKCVHYKQQAVI